MFPGLVLNKLKQLVPFSGPASVLKWEDPLNNAGRAVNQDPTKGQHEVIETGAMRNIIAQIVVAGATTAPTFELQGSMDGATWAVLDSVNVMVGGTLVSTDDYVQHRVECTAYTDGTATGRFEARE